MRNKFLLLGLLLLSAGLPGRAQDTESALAHDFATRTSVAIDKKLAPRLHLSAGYQLRTENNLGKIDRHQASLGLDYKFNNWLKGGLEYTFFDRYGSSAGWQPRHRLSGYATLGWRFGDWRLSLREMVQLTHKTEDLNPYQEVRNPVALKSRLKLQYKGSAAVEPYAFFELKTVLNDPACTAAWNAATQAYTSYRFDGYTDAYFSRYRGGLGLTWKLTPQHALECYGLLDYNRNKDLDTNKEGTRLKSLTWDRSLVTTVGIGYTFSF